MENRIEQTTVANAESNARLASGVVVPSSAVPMGSMGVGMLLAGVIGGLGAALPFLTGPFLILGSVALGSATAIGVFIYRGVLPGSPKGN